MAELINAPRGTADVLMDESYKWRWLSDKLARIVGRFGYREILLPTFEHTELFERGVGDTTDVVDKEMYTMLDRAGRSITLRPEGTANTARALLQHGILSGPLPARAFYIMSCFRYEKPQSGRYREFHQLGIELFGAPAPDADAEVIRVADTVLRECGIGNIRLELNSIGCPECRPKFHETLRAYFQQHYDDLCDTCRGRLERNPLRILDCKSPICSEIAKGAPVALDFLCDDCRDHFAEVRRLLGVFGIEYTVNPTIVRGLDYYSRTVFEFVHQAAGAQGTVCGGGRYDGLVEIIGGPPTPGIGFGMGLERLLSVMAAENAPFPADQKPQVFLCSVGDRGRELARELTADLQRRGIGAQYDLNGRSLKAQLKFADRLGAVHSLVIGDDEVDAKQGVLKSMQSDRNLPVSLDAAGIIEALEHTDAAGS